MRKVSHFTKYTIFYLMLMPILAFANSRIINFESAGNLQPSHQISCPKISELDSSYTPVDLYQGLDECVNKGKYANAVILFGLAGVYGRYDTLRVTDQSAYDAIDVLQMNYLSSIDKRKYKKLEQYLKTNFLNDKNLHMICEFIRKIGKPTYYPTYMIQHGMGAFIQKGPAISSTFNSTDAWNKSLVSYLHCKK